MSTTTKAGSVFLLMAVGLTFAAGPIVADQPIETDTVREVTTTSDTTLAVFARAIANRDTTLLGSLFPEDIEIALPRGKTVVGQKKVIKYAPLLFEKFGGCETWFKRVAMEAVVNYSDLYRDAGLVKFIGSTGEQADTIWSGAYTIYWRVTDSSTSMERIFVGRKDR